MPALRAQRIDSEGVCSHVFNRGVEERVIFEDQEDYGVFLGYLKEYLTPANPGANKKTFTVNGRTYEGLPHQPKNYFGKVELLAYSLMPNHFHLLLHQLTRGAQERLMRSLSTRYSMYFNKKYKRRGALFAGAYKSVEIADIPRLLLLTRFLHREGGVSSYPEYLEQRQSAWVKPKVVLSLKEARGYQKYVESHELDAKEKELLAGMTFEENEEMGEAAATASSGADVPQAAEVIAPPAWAYVGLVAGFFLLSGVGLRNVMVATASPSGPVVSGVNDEAPAPAAEQKSGEKTMLLVKAEEGESVSIRSGPDRDAAVIAESKSGAVYEFVAINAGWFGVKLADGSTGFIRSEYIQILESSN